MFDDEHILSPSKFYVTMTSSNELYVSNVCENSYQNQRVSVLQKYDTLCQNCEKNSPIRG